MPSPYATAVPRPKTKSQDALVERFTIDLIFALAAKMFRPRENIVTLLGQRARPFRPQFYCRSFDGSAANLFRVVARFSSKESALWLWLSLFRSGLRLLGCFFFRRSGRRSSLGACFLCRRFFFRDFFFDHRRGINPFDERDR